MRALKTQGAVKALAETARRRAAAAIFMMLIGAWRFDFYSVQFNRETKKVIVRC